MCMTIAGGQATTALPPTTDPASATTDVGAPPIDPATTAPPAGDATTGAQQPGDLAGILQALQAATATLQALVTQLAPGPSLDTTTEPRQATSFDGVNPVAAELNRLNPNPRDPTELLAAKYERELAGLPATDARRPAVEALRPQLDALREEAARTGAFDPAAMLGFDLGLRIALATGATHAGYVALQPRMDAIQAEARTSGSFNPNDLLDMRIRMEIVSAGPGTGAATQLQALLGAVAAMQQQSIASGSFNPIELQQRQDQLDAIVNGQSMAPIA